MKVWEATNPERPMLKIDGRLRGYLLANSLTPQVTVWAAYSHDGWLIGQHRHEATARVMVEQYNGVADGLTP